MGIGVGGRREGPSSHDTAHGVGNRFDSRFRALLVYLGGRSGDRDAAVEAPYFA